MEKNFWYTKWQNNDIAFHRQDINPDLITFYDNLQLKQSDTILVPLCGKSKDMIWLANKGHHVIGVELSPLACAAFFEEQGIVPHVTKRSHCTHYQYHSIELWCGDLFELNPQDFPVIHAMYDCKALIALPKEMRNNYVKQLVACAGRQCKILLLAIESQSEAVGPPFSVDENEINALYEPYFSVKQLKAEKVVAIEERLIKKGYRDITSTVYLMD